MVKRKVDSQIGSLTSNHRKSRIDPISLRAGGVQHVIEKLLTRATTSLQTSSWSEVCTRSYKFANLQKFQPWRLRDFHFGVSGQKNHLDEGTAERCRVYYMGEGDGFPWVRVVVSLVSSRLSVVLPSTKGVPTMH
jgi:hypothetical protein